MTDEFSPGMGQFGSNGEAPRGGALEAGDLRRMEMAARAVSLPEPNITHEDDPRVVGEAPKVEVARGDGAAEAPGVAAP